MDENLHYQWCEPTGTSDKEFIGWIYERLHSAFGERISLDYMQRLDKFIQSMPGVIPDKMQKALENNPMLAANREQFRQHLADLGHDEATCYCHWALEAFDKTFRLRD